MQNSRDELREKFEEMSDEEKIKFTKAAVNVVVGLNMKMMREDPHGYFQSLQYVRARRKTDEWAGHRTAEGIA